MAEKKKPDSALQEDTNTDITGKADSVSRGDAAGKVSRLPDVAVTVSMELGRTVRTLNEVLSIGEQSLIELDRMVGDPIDIYLNGKLFARGEVVTVSENFGVRVTEILNQE